MPDGGRLVIRTATVRAGEAPTPPGIRPKLGSHILLEVTDSGTGMDAATQAHLFEPFFTTKEPGKGTGLGLSTVYGIVEQSGGSVTVETGVGRGTTFRIYLPQVETPAPAGRPLSVARPAAPMTPVPLRLPPAASPVPVSAAPAPTPPPPAPLHAAPAPMEPTTAKETPSTLSETILLVEDALRVRAVVREILEMNGYHVLEARHGAERSEEAHV